MLKFEPRAEIVGRFQIVAFECGTATATEEFAGGTLTHSFPSPEKAREWAEKRNH